MSGLSPYLRLLRPHQWVKNGFVFVGLIFSRGWEQPALVVQVVLAAVAFSLAASSIPPSAIGPSPPGRCGCPKRWGWAPSA